MFAPVDAYCLAAPLRLLSLFIGCLWSRPLTLPPSDVMPPQLQFALICLPHSITTSSPFRTPVPYYMYSVCTSPSCANTCRLSHLGMEVIPHEFLPPAFFSYVVCLFWNPWNYWCLECTYNHQRVLTMMSQIRRGIKPFVWEPLTRG